MTKRQWSTDLPLGRQQFEGFFDPFKEPIGRWLAGILREIDVVLDEIPPGRCPPVYPSSGARSRGKSIPSRESRWRDSQDSSTGATPWRSCAPRRCSAGTAPVESCSGA